MSQLNLDQPIELTHEGIIMSADGRKWKAGIYAAGVVPEKLATIDYGKNLDPDTKYEYAKPPVLGDEDKVEPELKLELKVEDKPAAVKTETPAPTVVPAPSV